MAYEYDEEPLEGRILWGRIAVYGTAFVLVFLLGSCFGSRGAPSGEELQELSDRVRDLASENAVLEQQLEAASAGSQQPPDVSTTDGTGARDGGDGGEGEGGEGDGGGDPATDGQGSDEPKTYTVQSGDNLYRIAEQHYGDGSKWRLIADENGLDAANPLTVGQELRIPPLD